MRYRLVTTAVATVLVSLAAMSVEAQPTSTADVLCDFSATLGAHAVDPTVVASTPAEANQPATLASVSQAAALKGPFCELLKGIRDEEPGHLNSALASFVSPDSGIAFLKDIDFKLKAFEPKNGQGSSGLGFSYDYEKVNPLGEYSDDRATGVTSGFAWKYSAKGNVAFDSDLNPANFLDTRFSLSGFRNKWLARTTMLSFVELNKLENQLALIEDEEVLRAALADDSTTNIIKAIRGGLPRFRSYIDYEFNAGLESDQQFDQKQWTYGAQVALDFKAYDQGAWQTTFNILDWPFAVVRRLSGYDRKFRVYGSTIPTLVFGIDQVDPKDNSARTSLGATSKFERYRAEVFFRTPIARIRSNEVFFNFDYRYLKERSPPQSIVNAGLGSFKYTVISISSSSGVFVSYRDGKLPFDLEKQQVFEVGWKFNLGALQDSAR